MRRQILSPTLLFLILQIPISVVFGEQKQSRQTCPLDAANKELHAKVQTENPFSGNIPMPLLDTHMSFGFLVPQKIPMDFGKLKTWGYQPQVQKSSPNLETRCHPESHFYLFQGSIPF